MVKKFSGSNSIADIFNLVLGAISPDRDVKIAGNIVFDNIMGCQEYF